MSENDTKMCFSISHIVFLTDLVLGNSVLKRILWLIISWNDEHCLSLLESYNMCIILGNQWHSKENKLV